MIGNLAPEHARTGTTISKVKLESRNRAVISPALAIPELQGLRAAGCCLVFLAHALVIIYPERFVRSIEAPAGEYLARAVIGFFILSGVVLSLPYVAEGKPSLKLGRFYLDRLFRLYPAYLVSLVSALAIRFAILHSVGLSSISPWAQRFWSEPLTAGSLVQHLILIAIRARNINPVYWTLRFEIQAGLLFPVVIALVRRTRHWALSIVPVIGLTVLSHFFPLVPLIRVLTYFFMGAYLAKYNSKLKVFLGHLPAGTVLALSILIAAFFWVAPHSPISYRISFLVLDALLALLMVVVQAFRPLAFIANLRPVQRFAQLSYCFYLFHLPILAACAFTLYPATHSAPLTILAAFSVSTLLSAVVHRWVEQPTRAFSKTRTVLKQNNRRGIGISIGETTSAATQSAS